MRRNPFFDIAAVSIVVILLLWLLSTLILGTSSGNSIIVDGNLFGHQYKGGVYMVNGLAYGGTVTTLLAVLIKVLIVVFVLALAIGIFVWVKNSLFTDEDKAIIKNTFTGNRPEKKRCIECGAVLENDWQVCPHCGKETSL